MTDRAPLSPRTYTVEQVAEILGISRNLAYTAARENRLPVDVFKVGKRMFVRRTELDRLLGTSEVAQP